MDINVRKIIDMSNLSFISKLIEKVVAKPSNGLIGQEGISYVHQSACRSFNATEITLLKLQNNISTSVDSGEAVDLTLLDICTSF